MTPALHSLKNSKSTFLGIVVFATILLYSQLQARPVTDFTLSTIAGESITLSDYKGEVILVYFWASWTKEVENEMKSLISLKKRRPELVLLSINMDEMSPEEVKKWAEDHSLNFPVCIGKNEVYTTYQNYIAYPERGALPFGIIIDKNWDVVDDVSGYRDKELWYWRTDPYLEESKNAEE